MKKYTVFESAVIGFFVGVIAAAYLTFVTTTGGYLGAILDWLSLRPVTSYFNLPANELIVASFAFFVLVYTVYGAIIGALVKSVTKSRVIVVPTILLLLAVVAEQAVGTSQQLAVAPAPSQDGFSQTASALISMVHAASAAKPAADQQYFGAATSTEATGDLNGDGTDDVAFIIHRDDADRGTLYYLSAAIATTTGHIGTDLIFLGDKVIPRTIAIADGVIDIAYTIAPATTTRNFYFDIVDGHVQKTSAPVAATTTASTSGN